MDPVLVMNCFRGYKNSHDATPFGICVHRNINMAKLRKLPLRLKNPNAGSRLLFPWLSDPKPGGQFR
jgi:hypothetical protein